MRSCDLFFSSTLCIIYSYEVVYCIVEKVDIR